MSSIDKINTPEMLVLIMQTIKEDPFKTLIKISEPVTYSVINKYFFSGNEKEDNFQEACSVLYKAAKQYRIDEGMSFLSFYHMLLNNHFNMLVRKELTQKRRVNAEITSLDSLVEEAGDHVQGTSSINTYPEDVAIVREILDEYLIDLSPYEKQVFLSFLIGNSYEDIVEEYDSSVDKVRNALYRCAMKLKNIIED